jgi:outer membrane receptor for ferrienterochelin and colicins
MVLVAATMAGLVVAPAPAHAGEPLRATADGLLILEVRSRGVPVADAAVEGAPLDGLGARTRTDENGIATLRLPPGEVRVEVTHADHPAAVIHVGIPDEGEARYALELRPEGDEPALRRLSEGADPPRNVVEVGALTVSVTRTGRRVQDEPLRVEVIDREEIQEKMLMTPGSIAMLLAETGGIQIQTTSASLGQAGIRIRGMRGRYTQLLADGLPLYGGQAGGLGPLQVPPSDLGQLEVIKGVTSALYGPAALGGVVNLVSRRPAEEVQGELLLNAAARGDRDVSAYASGPLPVEGWSASVLAGHHRHPRVDLDGNGWVDLPGYERSVLRPRLFREGEDGSTLFLTAGGTTETRAGGTLPGRTTPDGAPFPEGIDTDRVDAGLSARRRAGGSRFFELRASAMQQRHRHTFGERVERDRHGTAFAEGTLAGTAGAHDWLLGLALQRDWYRSPAFTGFDYDFTVPAVFAQHEVRLSPEVTAASSLRWDRHSAYGSHLSPRVSLLLWPGAWTARVSAGGGFFAPTPFVETIEATGLARLEPVEGLSAEKARSVSLDAGRMLGPFEVNGALFASWVRDGVRLLDAGPERLRLVNAPGLARTAGSELLVRYRRGDISVTGSYVHVRATEPVVEGAGVEGDFEGVGPNARRAVPLTPRHTAGLVAMWEDHDRGLLGVEAYYTGAQELEDDPYLSRGRPYVHLGVLGELRRGPLSVFLNAENLLDERQTRHAPLLREERAPDGRWTVDAWGPLEGITVNLGVRVRIGGGDDHHDDPHH